MKEHLKAWEEAKLASPDPHTAFISSYCTAIEKALKDPNVSAVNTWYTSASIPTVTPTLIRPSTAVEGEKSRKGVSFHPQTILRTPTPSPPSPPGTPSDAHKCLWHLCFPADTPVVSQTHKLIMHITQVCQETCDMKYITTTVPTQSPPSTHHKSKENPPNTGEKDGRDYTCSKGSTTYDRYEDPHNSLNTPIHHAEDVPLTLPPPEPSESMSSHTSSEPSKAGASTSYNEPPCNLTGSTFVLTMVLSSSQKETKESSDEQDLRGGGLLRPEKTREWRSLKDSGIRDYPKLPTMAHWQEDEGEEC